MTVTGTTLPVAPDTVPDAARVASLTKRNYSNTESAIPTKKQASAVSVAITGEESREVPMWVVDLEGEEDFY
jgi:hypothetical protein